MFNSLILELTVEQHLKGKDLNQPLSFLVGFRSFMNYHLHAMKQQLHSRMRKKVELFERVIVMAKRDKEGPKNWKETHGGITEVERELKEEKKVEEVFVFQKK
jgi:actin related protein 2/3 complex subunit 2